jgi:hypothetical protein
MNAYRPLHEAGRGAIHALAAGLTWTALVVLVDAAIRSASWGVLFSDAGLLFAAVVVAPLWAVALMSWALVPIGAVLGIFVARQSRLHTRRSIVARLLLLGAVTGVVVAALTTALDALPYLKLSVTVVEAATGQRRAVRRTT